MKFIIFDFEIFKKATLLGCMIIDNDKNTKEIVQMWDEDQIRDFYYNHINDLWLGWNNFHYDNAILESIIRNKSAYEMNNLIVKQGIKPPWCRLEFINYDIMKERKTMLSLKLTELISGKNISETEVSFDLDRELTDEEKRLTEEYNKADLEQTYYNFQKFKNSFELRIDIIQEFGLDLKSNLNTTGTQLGGIVLGVKKRPELIYSPAKPMIYDSLRLNNKELLDFYLNEKFRNGETLKINICGDTVDIMSGGAHSSLKKYTSPKVIYLDINGYYNRIQMNYDLFSRAVPEKGKELYAHMFVEQNKLKKTNPIKRAGYKTVLLSCWGGAGQKYSDFYDPNQGALIPVVGEMFMMDLLEKLEGKVKLVQTNTDGIFVEPFDWSKESEIMKIVEEWEQRTGFVVKKEHIYNLWQRDVNNYICVTEDGELDYKGEVFKNYSIDDKAYASEEIFNCTNPPIVARGVADYLIKGIPPEETVEQNKKDLRMFQYPCKKNTYDYLTEDLIVSYKNEKGKIVSELEKSTKIQNINRVFAAKIYKKDDKTYTTTITKHKTANGKTSMAKVANLPDSVFVYNKSILEPQVYEELKDNIDWDYYIDRIYERIMEFIPSES